MSQKVSEKSRQDQYRYKNNFGRKFWTSPRFSFRQFVYENCLQMVLLSTNINAEKYSKLLRRAYGSLRVSTATKHTLTLDESGISNTILADQASVVIPQLILQAH